MNSSHNKFEILATTTCDNRVVATRTKCNPSINNYKIINRGIRRTINSIYNKKIR